MSVHGITVRVLGHPGKVVMLWHNVEMVWLTLASGHHLPPGHLEDLILWA